jgi:hypothetical protein
VVGVVEAGRGRGRRWPALPILCLVSMEWTVGSVRCGFGAALRSRHARDTGLDDPSGGCGLPTAHHVDGGRKGRAGTAHGTSRRPTPACRRLTGRRTAHGTSRRPAPGCPRLTGRRAARPTADPRPGPTRGAPGRPAHARVRPATPRCLGGRRRHRVSDAPSTVTPGFGAGPPASRPRPGRSPRPPAARARSARRARRSPRDRVPRARVRRRRTRHFVAPREAAPAR